MENNKTLIIQGKFELTPFTGTETANVPIIYKTDDGKLNAGIIADSLKDGNKGAYVLTNRTFDSSLAPLKYILFENILWVCDAQINDGSRYNWTIE